MFPEGPEYGSHLIALDHYVVDICDEILAFLFVKNTICHPRKGRACVLQSLRHPPVTISSSWGDETHFLFIIRVHLDLVIPREIVQ